jgi:hypothetical protein
MQRVSGTRGVVNYALRAIQETKSKSPYPSSEGSRPYSSDQSAIYPPHPPQELSLVGTKDATYFQHLLCNFFAMGQESENPGHCGNRTWMLACLRNEQNMPTSTIAMRWLATSFFVRTHDQVPIMQDGAYLYGQALMALNESLHNSNSTQTFDILAATTALCYYKHIMFTSQHG